MKQPVKSLIDWFFFFWQRVSRTGQWLFPWMPSKGNCRFTPTCSQFARQAVKRYGMILGVWITLKRLGKCHPFHIGGDDPIEKYLW